jgi:hypothetical protein
MNGRLAVILGFFLFATAILYTKKVRTITTQAITPQSVEQSSVKPPPLPQPIDRPLAPQDEPKLPTIREFMDIKQVPMRIDASISLVSFEYLEAVKEVNLTYYISLPSKDSSKERKSWESSGKREQIERVLSNNCSHHEMQFLLKGGYRFMHAYYSSRGAKHEFTFTVDEGQCMSREYPGKPQEWADLPPAPKQNQKGIKAFGPRESKSEVIVVR